MEYLYEVHTFTTNSDYVFAEITYTYSTESLLDHHRYICMLEKTLRMMNDDLYKAERKRLGYYVQKRNLKDGYMVSDYLVMV